MLKILNQHSTQRLRPILLLLVVTMLASCTSNDVKENNSLKKYFDENNVDGCFGMFDNGHGIFTL
ncbi:MAG: hypothetical protein ACXWCG_07455, partial [Flavitalea sp.]